MFKYNRKEQKKTYLFLNPPLNTLQIPPDSNITPIIRHTNPKNLINLLLPNRLNIQNSHTPAFHRIHLRNQKSQPTRSAGNKHNLTLRVHDTRNTVPDALVENPRDEDNCQN